MYIHIYTHIYIYIRIYIYTYIIYMITYQSICFSSSMCFQHSLLGPGVSDGVRGHHLNAKLQWVAGTAGCLGTSGASRAMAGHGGFLQLFMGVPQNGLVYFMGKSQWIMTRGTLSLRKPHFCGVVLLQGGKKNAGNTCFVEVNRCLMVSCRFSVSPIHREK